MRTRPREPSYRVGSRVLVETTSGWMPAYVTGFRSGDVGEDFQRVDVMLDDGRRWNGCDPLHVRKAG
jgi:hypothetical protein